MNPATVQQSHRRFTQADAMQRSGEGTSQGAGTLNFANQQLRQKVSLTQSWVAAYYAMAISVIEDQAFSELKGVFA
jgi:hypothetical protein